VPKRQPKPELITPEEVMGTPALQGFDTFLRYGRAEDLPAPIRQPQDSQRKVLPIGKTPIGVEDPDAISIPEVQQPDIRTGLESPIGQTPIGMNDRGFVDIPSSVPIIRPPRKVRRAVKVQDAHSSGEQALYQALWNAGVLETSDTRLIRIGYGGMQSLCGLDKSNCKDNILSLIKKLAIEVMSGFDIRRNEGNTYRVFSYGMILKRRKAAGMEWVIRSRGVQFVSQPPMGKEPIGDQQLPIGDMPPGPLGDSPTGAMGETPTGPMGKTPIASRKGKELQETDPSSSLIWDALQPHCKVIDDDALRQLVARCRTAAPDCTEEEIAHFTKTKAEYASARPSTVHNLMGFLQTAVPRCFEGAPFRKFRAEQARRREAEQQRRTEVEAETTRMLAEQRAILADANASEEDKRFARRILDIPESGDEEPAG
jgi:hypothetical protein